jgi:hypothetical protein
LAVVLMAAGAFRAEEKGEGKWNIFARMYGRASEGDEQVNIEPRATGF